MNHNNDFLNMITHYIIDAYIKAIIIYSENIDFFNTLDENESISAHFYLIMNGDKFE